MQGTCVLQYDYQEDHSYRQSVTWTSATFGMRYITKSSEFYSHKAAASVEQYFLSHESIITTRLWCSLGAQLITLGQKGFSNFSWMFLYPNSFKLKQACLSFQSFVMFCCLVSVMKSICSFLMFVGLFKPFIHLLEWFGSNHI